MDALHSLSNIFNEEFQIKISMKCGEKLIMDSNLAHHISDFSELGENLEIKLYLEK